jgi:hypothetical protein
MQLFEQLKAERAELSARIAQIDTILAEHERLVRAAGKILGGSRPDMVTSDSERTRLGGFRESGSRRVSTAVSVFERKMLEILTETSTPLDRNALYAHCVDRGIDVGGKEPLNTLASRMSRMPEVTNIRGQGYWLRSRLPELSRVNEPAPKTARGLGAEVEALI